jgi:hypothetical protein
MAVNLMDQSAIPAAVDEDIRQGESEAGRIDAMSLGAASLCSTRASLAAGQRVYGSLSFDVQFV